MKNTTKKILLSMYFENITMPRYVSYQAISLLVPELTKEGLRSLIHLLEKKELIHTTKIKGTSYYSLTDQARKALKTQFQALTTNSEISVNLWKVIIFKTAPKGDPQFRYLRSKILHSGGVALSRGSFIFTTDLSRQLLHTLETLYNKNIYMFSVGEWYLGTQNPIISEQFHISDLINTYSSISREIDDLLIKFEAKKGLIGSLKNDFSSIYQRWFDTFSEDKGLMSVHFPHETSGVDVLKKLQHILLQY